MKFDAWPEDLEIVTKPPVCPPGTWPATIREAREILDPYTAERYPDENPRGQKLVMTIDVDAAGNRFTIKTDIPAHWRAAIVNLARAAGVPTPSRDQDWDEAELIGRSVIVTTTNKDDAKGRTWTRVERWHALESPADAGDRKLATPKDVRGSRISDNQKPATRTRTKPTPTGDDIPF